MMLGSAHVSQHDVQVESLADSPYVPVAVTSRYEPPRAGIDPDRSKSWLRRALPLLVAHKRTFITSLVMSFVGLVLQVQIPNLLNRAINNSIVASMVPSTAARAVPLSHYVWWVVGLAVVGGFAGFISRLLLFKTAYNIEYDLRNIIYEHLSRLSFPFYDTVQTGQLISRANSDIRSVNMYMAFAPSVLVQCSIALVAFGFMLSINVPLAIVAMATMPLVYFGGVRMRRAIFPVSWLIQSRLADVATIVDENVNGVRVVRSFAAERQQLNLLARAAARLRWSYVKDADIRAAWTPVVQGLPQLGMVLVLVFGGYLVIQHHLGIGAILAFSAYLLMLQVPFMMLGMIVMMGQRAKASAGRIYEILDQPPTIVDRPGAIDLENCRGDVRFESVSFSYEMPALGTIPSTASSPSAKRPSTTAPAKTRVLDGFDLHIRPGETVALVGRTGSGKSTAARLLPRFYDVDEGAVRIDGHDVRDLTLASLRAHVGIVLDEPFLFSASIRDNIAYGRPHADIAEVRAAAIAAAADGFIRELPQGYDTVVGERGYTLSGGQRQRIALARTLLMNPPILVLDDATSAIDVQVEQEIHAALATLMAGRTTLIIAHRLSTIALAERVVLVDRGRVVAQGTHEELLATTPLYAEVLAQGAERDAEAHDRGIALDRGWAARATPIDVNPQIDLGESRGVL